MKMVKATWIAALPQWCFASIGSMNRVQPYCRLAIITRQMMPKPSWPQRVHFEAAARAAEPSDATVISAPTHRRRPERVAANHVNHQQCEPLLFRTSLHRRVERLRRNRRASPTANRGHGRGGRHIDALGTSLVPRIAAEIVALPKFSALCQLQSFERLRICATQRVLGLLLHAGYPCVSY